MLHVVIRGLFPCLASLGSYDRGAQELVRVFYYMNQAPCTIRALLGRWQGEGGAHAWDDVFGAEGGESEEYHLLKFCSL